MKGRHLTRVQNTAIVSSLLVLSHWSESAREYAKDAIFPTLNFTNMRQGLLLIECSNVGIVREDIVHGSEYLRILLLLFFYYYKIILIN